VQRVPFASLRLHHFVRLLRIALDTATGHTMRTWIGLTVLSLGAAVTLLNLAVLSPLLQPISREFGTSEATTGQLATIAALVSVVSSLAATPWMDRWSRRTWLQLEGAVLLAAIIISALAPSFAWLLGGRVLAAFGGAVIMANCMTGARELFQDSVWRNRAIGIIVSATTLAFVVGLPAITQIEARAGWRLAMAATAIPVVLLFGGTFALPPSPARSGATVAQGGILSSFGAVLGDGRTRALLVVLGLNLGLYTGWLVYFGAYITEVFAASATILSALFFLSGVTELAANNLTPPVLRRVDPILALYVLLAAVGAVLLLTGIAITSIPGAFVAAVVVLNGTAAAYIATNALLLEGDRSHPGAVMSVASAAIGVGNALGPFVAGWALANTGSFEAGYRALGLLAPVAMLALWLGTRRRHPVAAPNAA
jgi:DHA1 family inner membrane transport protein